MNASDTAGQEFLDDDIATTVIQQENSQLLLGFILIFILYHILMLIPFVFKYVSILDSVNHTVFPRATKTVTANSTLLTLTANSVKLSVCSSLKHHESRESEARPGCEHGTYLCKPLRYTSGRVPYQSMSTLTSFCSTHLMGWASLLQDFNIAIRHA